MTTGGTCGQVRGPCLLPSFSKEQTSFFIAPVASACEGQVLGFNHPYNFIMLSTLNSLQPRQLLTQVPIPPCALLECAKFNFSRS